MVFLFGTADLYGIIFVTEVKADMNGDQLNHLEKLLHFDRPILICANKASTHWVNSFKRRNAGRMPEHVRLCFPLCCMPVNRPGFQKHAVVFATVKLGASV